MEQRLGRLESKLDLLMDKQSEVNVKVAELAVVTSSNTDSLREHMAQTLEVRKQTQLLFEAVEAIKTDLNRTAKRLRPIEVFVDRAKFLGVIAGTATGAFLAVLKSGILNHFFHIQ